MTTDTELIYVWDAYCGWCYGFSDIVHRLHENHPELPLTILSGGLFVGIRSVAMSSFPHIPAANERISQLTGVKFGSGYEQLVVDGRFVMDSEQAAIGFDTLRSLAPQRALDLAAAMQKAFYDDGMSLSDPETYRMIAEANQLDVDAVMERWNDPASVQAVRHEFTHTRELGVDSYPTLLLRQNDEWVRLPMTTDMKQLEAELARVSVQQGKEAQFCSVDDSNHC